MNSKSGELSGEIDSDCRSVNVSVIATGDNVGALVGRTFETDKAIGGYYYGGKRNDSALSGVGNNAGGGTANTVPVFKLTVPKGVTVTGGETVEYNGETYCKTGSISLTRPETISKYLTVNGTDLTNETDRVVQTTISGDTTIGISGIATIPGLSYNPADGRYYEISTAADLQVLSAYVNGEHNCSGMKFKQTADIDLSTVANFTPIGTFENKNGKVFRGEFDGGNKTISNLAIDGTEKFQGLFGCVGNGGKISNINVKNADITLTYIGSANSYAAAIVAYIAGTDSTVSNCLPMPKSSTTAHCKITTRAAWSAMLSPEPSAIV